MTVGPDLPDYSRPSVDVERRAGAEWEWGVTHTVRPEKLVPMLPDVEYSITVKVQRKVAEPDRDTTFAALHARALTIADARCHELAGHDAGVHQWIMCHAWRSVAAGGSSLVFAVVMMGLMRAAAGRTAPPGESAPTPRELMTGGGATMEEMQRQSPQRATEVFVDFDHRLPDASGTPRFIYSYGERVAVPTVESFEPFVRRAEHHARAHQALVGGLGASPIPSSIGLCEWYMADNLLTVELHLKP
jgi:hypothetical protein